MREQLERFLGERRGKPTSIVRLDRLTVGHSRAMYRVECDDGERFVVRVEQGGVFGTSSAEEYDVMTALQAAGSPVARPRWSEPTGAVIGQPFFVMDFVDGEGSDDGRSLDVATARSFVQVLRDLHDVERGGAERSGVERGGAERSDAERGGVEIPFHAPRPTAADATHAQIDRWHRVYRDGADAHVPLLERAAAWLHREAPPLERLSVVHGDAGPGNLLHAGGRVVALTDFEFAHLGDPDEDWVFCLAMRGVRTMPRGAWEEILAEHGVVIPPERFHYWEAFNMFKGSCANLTCLRLFERGVNAAPNMAIIGTALHQVFLRRLTDLITAPPPSTKCVSPPNG